MAVCLRHWSRESGGGGKSGLLWKFDQFCALFHQTNGMITYT